MNDLDNFDKWTLIGIALIILGMFLFFICVAAFGINEAIEIQSNL